MAMPMPGITPNRATPAKRGGVLVRLHGPALQEVLRSSGAEDEASNWVSDLSNARRGEEGAKHPANTHYSVVTWSAEGRDRSPQAAPDGARSTTSGQAIAVPHGTEGATCRRLGAEEPSSRARARSMRKFKLRESR